MTSAFAASLSCTLAAVIVAASIASLKVAVTVVVRLTPIAPLAGVMALTTGGVVSGATVVEKTTSTQ